MKKLLKLFAFVQAIRSGGRGSGTYRPATGGKWRRNDYRAQGYQRSRGLKGALLEAVVNRVLRRR